MQKTMQTLTIKLPEAKKHREALLRVLYDSDSRLPFYTADPTVTVHLANNDAFWTVYSCLCAVRNTCDAAPTELAGLSTAVDVILDEIEVRMNEAHQQFLKDVSH